jgi:L-ascorbate metabolism protein UlaG (beta-lactamase superfamily)
MRLTYFGHSCFLLEIEGPPGDPPVGALAKAGASAKRGARLVLDPYLVTNPHGAVDPSGVPCDFVLCSHAHDDHICDALVLAQLHDATIVAPFELASYFSAQGAATIDLMPGGGVNFPWGRIEMTPAVHSSSIELPDGTNRPMGIAAGYVVRADGRAVYHAGDTALFGDMSLIARGGLDLALVPIGDRYTMGAAGAVEALNLLDPRLAVPMHYNTSEQIRADPFAFAADAARAGHDVRVLAAGGSLEL